MAAEPSDGRRRNYLLSTLEGDERRRIEPLLERVHLGHKTVLAARGEPIEALYFPVNCVTSTLMELPEGDTVEVGMMGAEGVTGLSLIYGEPRSGTTVIVQVPGAAERIAARDFVREVVEPGGSFYRLLLRYSNLFMSLVAQNAACNASHNVEQRCARWLALSEDRVRQDRFPITHEYLALMLGVRRASVTGAMNALRLTGALEYDRGQIHVLNRETLVRASCGCYAVMAAMTDALIEALPERA
ncbi:MAG: Crp/Fnr family transcriptional regulator [Candidatus Eremiobacteraeota bacterium]|nr:Crp/Fnr family transcriptional regulator [Candidatus Eremiobacteraeota bacterium]MBV8368285.1 Crp/Fnr family transcriptional regulator [Candidatus Eremiobacteraeota bacterium]